LARNALSSLKSVKTKDEHPAADLFVSVASFKAALIVGLKVSYADKPAFSPIIMSGSANSSTTS